MDSRLEVGALKWVLELWVKQHSGRERRERELSFRPSEFLVLEEQPPLPSWVRLSLGEQGFVSGHQH